ncbi:MAG: ROK family protein [Synergistaceae bacterium]|nr:ROK family protein [Synergistaceae bacterium]
MRAIGIDLGGHNISAALVEFGCGTPRIVSRIDIPTPAGRKLDDIINCLTELSVELAADYPLDNVGIGMPGFLDRERNTVVRLTNFPGLTDIKFPMLLKEALRLRGLYAKVSMENDANCAALGEGLCGAACGCSDYIVMTLGTGIGTGIVANGVLLAGAHGMAGESGHIAVMNDKTICGCGGISHLESSASADWIEGSARNAGLPGEFKYLWGSRDNEAIASIIEPALDALARGIASLIVTTDPEAMILSGGMSHADGIAEELTKRTLPYLSDPFRPYLNIIVSKLGNDAALFGAASLKSLEDPMP